MITPLDGVINIRLYKYTYLLTLLFWITSNKTRITHMLCSEEFQGISFFYFHNYETQKLTKVFT